MAAGNPGPVRWGVLSTANIGVKLVVPAMQRSSQLTVAAIASREAGRAQAAARSLGIPTAYGSYEELIADPAIEAIYNPLPNHLHVPWSIKAAEAGKHVLCEKPIAMNAAEARQLLAVRDRTGVQVAEAFMVRAHPRWIAARELVRSGRIGELKLVVGHFSYYRRDPEDIRSKVEWGGGALLDIGCYPTTLSRYLFGTEPEAVTGTIEHDPDFKVDRLVSALLRFPGGQAAFTCGGQLVPWQRMQIFGTQGRIDVEIPFNAPPDHRCRLYVDDGSDFFGRGIETIEFPAVDQYQLQAERFGDAVRGRGPLPAPLEDAVANMAVLDALVRSAASGKWERP